MFSVIPYERDGQLEKISNLFKLEADLVDQHLDQLSTIFNESLIKVLKEHEIYEIDSVQGFDRDCLMISENGHYMGHVYLNVSKTDEHILEINGIRSSIYNMLMRKFGEDHCANIGNKLVQKAIDIAREKRMKSLVIIWPLSVMQGIVSKMGFKHYQGQDWKLGL